MPDASTIDPGYGGYAGTNRLLAAATNGPDVANAWQQNKLLQTQNQAAQLALAHQQLGALYDVASSVVADPSPDNLNARLHDAVQSGLITPQQASDATSEVAGFGGDPARIKSWAFQHAQMAASYQQRIQAAYGDPALVDNGNSLNPYTVKQGPQAGYYPTQGGTGSIPLQLGPRDRVNTQPGVGPQGQAGNYPVGQLYDNNGNFRGAAPAGSAPTGPQPSQQGQGSPQAGTAPSSSASMPTNPASASGPILGLRLALFPRPFRRGRSQPWTARPTHGGRSPLTWRRRQGPRSASTCCKTL